MKSKVFKKALLKPVAMPDKPKSAGIDFRYRFKVFVCVKLLLLLLPPLMSKSAGVALF